MKWRERARRAWDEIRGKKNEDEGEDKACASTRCAHCRDRERLVTVEGRAYTPEALSEVEREWLERGIIH